jgi:hypothetical protein
MPKPQPKTLEAIADIRSGYTFRDKIKEDPQGNLRFVQIKDIKGRFVVPVDTLPRVQWPDVAALPLVQARDVVLPARGEYYEAAIIEGSGPVVATGQLFVLRPRGRAVTPEFLCWYLSRPAAQSYFRSARTGSNIPMLNKQALGALPVPVPSLEIQRKITALNDLWERERRLTERLLHNRERMFAGIFQKLLER